MTSGLTDNFYRAGMACAAMMALASGLCNLLYGLSLGATPVEKTIYGGMSIASDGLKVVLAIGLSSLTWRQWRLTTLGGAVFALCFSYSVLSALGFAATTRTDRAAERQVVKELTFGAQNMIDQQRQRIAYLDARIKKIIEAPHPNWLSSRGCVNDTIDSSKKLCQHYRKMVDERTKLDGVVWQLHTDLKRSKIVSYKDPQTWALAQIIPLGAGDEQTIRVAIIYFIVLFIECGAAFSPAVLKRMRVSTPSPVVPVDNLPVPLAPLSGVSPQQTVLTPPSDSHQVSKLCGKDADKSQVKEFFATFVEPAPGMSLTAGTVYQEYQRWRSGSGAMSLARFGLIVNEIGIEKHRRGRVHYMHIRFREDRWSVKAIA